MALVDGNYAIEPLPRLEEQPVSPYYDERTGKTFARLPADPYSLQHYARRGLRPGVLPRGFTSTASPQSETPTVPSPVEAARQLGLFTDNSEVIEQPVSEKQESRQLSLFEE